MKRLLPKTKNNTQGFTLIELLVVIAIIAILSVIGVTVFSGVQKNARDAKRRADVDAISTAFEGHYNVVKNQLCGNGVGGIAIGTDANSSTYCPVQDSWFAGGVKPKIPNTTTDYTYTPTTLLSGTSTASSTFVICSDVLENGGGNSSTNTSITSTGTLSYYCDRNTQ